MKNLYLIARIIMLVFEFMLMLKGDYKASLLAIIISNQYQILYERRIEYEKTGAGCRLGPGADSN